MCWVGRRTRHLGGHVEGLGELWQAQKMRGGSLLGACLHSSSCTRVVANLSPKLQSHSRVAVIHAQHSHLVLRGTLSTPQGICPGLETKHNGQLCPYGDSQGGLSIPAPLHTPRPYYARHVDHLVVVSQMHCMPLSITQASWNCGADHCVGFTCGEYAHGCYLDLPSGTFPPHLYRYRYSWDHAE